MRKSLAARLRISHLLWITLVVAAFLGGYQYGYQAKNAEVDDAQVFSFYFSLTR